MPNGPKHKSSRQRLHCADLHQVVIFLNELIGAGLSSARGGTLRETPQGHCCPARIRDLQGRSRLGNRFGVSPTDDALSPGASHGNYGPSITGTARSRAVRACDVAHVAHDVPGKARHKAQHNARARDLFIKSSQTGSRRDAQRSLEAVDNQAHTQQNKTC